MKRHLMTGRFPWILAVVCWFVPPDARGAVTFSVLPAGVSNTYAGNITLTVTGLTNGETVGVDKYLDANTNNAIDAGDLLVQSFLLTDGQASVFHDYDHSVEVTNPIVPGDWNPTGGAITFTQSFVNTGLPQRMVAKYLYRLSRSTGPVATNLFAITNTAFGQSFTGTVRSSNTNVPYAGVLLFVPGSQGGLGWPAGGVIANSAGSYTIRMPPGTYQLIPFRSNFVANVATAPVLSLNAGATLTTNLNLYPASRSISGRLVDSGNTNLGLPGMLVAWISTNHLFAVGFTTTNGSFSTPVTNGLWQLGGDESDLEVHGYLGLEDSYRPQVSTVSGNASGVTVAYLKATALVYGRVNNALGQPLPAANLYGCSNDCMGEFFGCATTDQDGFYAMSVAAGDLWNVDVDSGHIPAYADYVFNRGDSSPLTLAAGQAVRLDFNGHPVWFPFLSQPVRLSATQMGFTLAGAAGTNYTVLVSTNLTAPMSSWVPVFVTNLTGNTALLVDPQATNKQLFYRVKVGP